MSLWTRNMFKSGNTGGQERRLKRYRPDDDKCHTLNHMFLLNSSDRSKEDLWPYGILFFFFLLTSLCLYSGTASTNSNTAALFREFHFPSLGMSKWLWRYNSLILCTEQCSSYCYGKSMWLSWSAAGPKFNGTRLSLCQTIYQDQCGVGVRVCGSRSGGGGWGGGGLVCSNTTSHSKISRKHNDITKINVIIIGWLFDKCLGWSAKAISHKFKLSQKQSENIMNVSINVTVEWLLM